MTEKAQKIYDFFCKHSATGHTSDIAKEFNLSQMEANRIAFACGYINIGIEELEQAINELKANDN